MSIILQFVLSHWRMALALGATLVMLGLVKFYKHEAEKYEGLYQEAVAAGRLQEERAKALEAKAAADKKESDDAHIKAIGDLAVVYNAAFKRLLVKPRAGSGIVPVVPGTTCLGAGAGGSARREAIARGMADAGRRLQQSLDRDDQLLQQGALRLTQRGDKYHIDSTTCAQWAVKEYNRASQVRSTTP